MSSSYHRRLTSDPRALSKEMGGLCSLFSYLRSRMCESPDITDVIPSVWQHAMERKQPANVLQIIRRPYCGHVDLMQTGFLLKPVKVTHISADVRSAAGLRSGYRKDLGCRVEGSEAVWSSGSYRRHRRETSVSLRRRDVH